jgi:hypothetical protein
VAAAHEVAGVPLLEARRAHEAQLLQPDWRRAWILTPSVFRLAQRQLQARWQHRHHRPQLWVRPVVDAVAQVVELALDVVAVVQVDKVVLRLLQTACLARPLRMADVAVVLRLPLSRAFHSSDRQPMETFWSRGIRSPRKKHGVDLQILRRVTTRAERSRPQGTWSLQASLVASWLSKPIPVNRFSVWQQDYPPAPVRQ